LLSYGVLESERALLDAEHAIISQARLAAITGSPALSRIIAERGIIIVIDNWESR
jgi:hypothetical protein